MRRQVGMEGVKFHSISVERGGYKQTISRNKQGALYFTGTSTNSNVSGLEYRSMSLEEAKSKLFEMITGLTEKDLLKVDYKI